MSNNQGGLPSILSNKRTSIAEQAANQTRANTLKITLESTAPATLPPKPTKKLRIDPNLSNSPKIRSKSKNKKQLTPKQQLALEKKKNEDYMKSLVPGTGGNPMGALLRMSRVSN